MLFNSYIFIFAFMPLFLLAYFGVFARLGKQVAVTFVAAASVLFYAWWNPWYVALIVASMLANYGVGDFLARTKTSAHNRKALATIAVCANLALLVYYKYANFFVNNFNDITGAHYLLEHIALPLGVSFFTFEQVSYVVDAYKGKAPHYSFIEYLFFVTFFPHLVAGPIINHHDLLTQLEDPKFLRFDPVKLNTGLTFFIIGLFKKVVIADPISGYVAPVFEAVAHGKTPGAAASWLGVFAYSLQLYYDFSGYSDMAIGLAQMINLRLPLNFNSPYKAVNAIDFWRRWHMTLSRFLRDYLYIPMGGGRVSSTRRYTNLLITMLLGGLWHGAGWGFVLWGGLNGLFLVVNHGFRYLRGAPDKPLAGTSRLGLELSMTVTFVAIMLSRVFFRAVDWHGAMVLYKSLAGVYGAGWAEAGALKPWLVCLAAYLWSRYAPNSHDLLAHRQPVFPPTKPTPTRWRWSISLPWAVAAGGMGFASFLCLTKVSEFLYFQF